ncbi:amino acid ABC transporter permease [Glycomyces sp. TRM65418]|uniref:amino acid ABC transporter permease n=1 Tax=Glycomyces sp. TRM65418 TaxID=2867006 RepID=UPI001CE50CB7|nr:amino acid ABC transporter permease [Glycomyces sp. TRM65418]MCC3762014.1 amino acid ABC transporter permease [Glycomyces sp. TRM65418]QZD56088.1 amino acid ABC transporter permease [Glycomyces sp. TRM65418]
MSRPNESTVLFDALGPKGRRNSNIASVVSAVVLLGLLALAGVQLAAEGFFEQSRWANPLDILVVQTTWVPAILDTLLAFALGSVLALLLGVIIGFGRISQFAPTRWLSAGYVQFFRAVPLVLLIWITFTIDGRFGFTTDVLGWSNDARRLTFLVLGLGIYNGAILAEILRAGVAALPPGQAMAGYAIGLRHGQVQRLVVLPQVVRNMLPAVLAQLVILLKDTSLGYVITYPELLHSASIVGRDYGNSFLQALVIAAFIYFVLAYVLSKLVVVAERRLRKKTAAPLARVQQVEAAAVTD